MARGSASRNAFNSTKATSGPISNDDDSNANDDQACAQTDKEKGQANGEPQPCHVIAHSAYVQFWSLVSRAIAFSRDRICRLKVWVVLAVMFDASMVDSALATQPFLFPPDQLFRHLLLQGERVLH